MFKIGDLIQVKNSVESDFCGKIGIIVSYIPPRPEYQAIENNCFCWKVLSDERVLLFLTSEMESVQRSSNWEIA